MELVKSKDNTKDRAIIRISHDKVRVVAEQSKQHRVSKTRFGGIKMFDFDGGPHFTLGGKFEFENMFWRVDNISELKADIRLKEVVLTISPVYTSTNPR